MIQSRLLPSILSADFSVLKEEILACESAGCEILHVDVMDGQFVQNISFGAPIIASIRPYTKMIFDVHLMVDEPGRYVESFANAGADIITVHAEATKHIHGTLGKIKALGKKAGMAVNPGTPAEAFAPVWSLLDLALVMSVNPGFGGQSLIPETLDKFDYLHELRQKSNREVILEIDGGVNRDNIQQIAQKVEYIVAGSAIFKKGQDTAENYRDLNNKLAS